MPGAVSTAQSAPLEAVDQPKWAVPCECTVADHVDRTERALSRARIPDRYRFCDFKSFETEFYYDSVPRDRAAAWNNSLSYAKMKVQGFVREFPTCRDMGLLLMGPVGVGKTHLAVAAVKEILSKGHSALFYDYAELLKLIQSTYNPATELREMDVLEPVLKCDLLALDDLGSSKPSMWALETVGHILTTRYNESRFTIITTNYLDSDSAVRRDTTRDEDPDGRMRKEGPPPDISRSTRIVTTSQDEYRRISREDTFQERITKRIRSRLYEMCLTIEIWSADRREYMRKSRVSDPSLERT